MEDWIRYELQENESYSRVLFTNIPLDIEAVNHYLQERIVVKDIDVGKYINAVDFDWSVSMFDKNDKATIPAMNKSELKSSD